MKKMNLEFKTEQCPPVRLLCLDRPSSLLTLKICSTQEHVQSIIGRDVCTPQ